MQEGPWTTFRGRGDRDPETRLRDWFRKQDLNPDALCAVAEDPPSRVQQLLTLARWVCVYGARPSRSELSDIGFHLPPGREKDDPETRWARFERWMRREPLSWTLQELADGFKPADQLTAREIRKNVGIIEGILAQRNVVAEICPEVPPRIAYDYLLEVLRNQRFDAGPPGSFHSIGCDGVCLRCFQRPWCHAELGSDTGDDGGAPEEPEETCELKEAV